MSANQEYRDVIETDWMKIMYIIGVTERVVEIFIKVYENQRSIHRICQSSGRNFYIAEKNLLFYAVALYAGRSCPKVKASNTAAKSIPIVQKPFINFPGISPEQSPHAITRQTGDAFERLQDTYQRALANPDQMHFFDIPSEGKTFCIMTEIFYDKLIATAKAQNVKK